MRIVDIDDVDDADADGDSSELVVRAEDPDNDGGFGFQLPPFVWILRGSAKWPRLLFVKVGFVRINVGFGSIPGI